MTTSPETESTARGIDADGLEPAEVGPKPSVGASLLRTARPKQWVKNVLVFAAPAAAGKLATWETLGTSIFAFAIFALASIGTYFVNDALDHKSDRLHPRKRNRPVAAGHVGLGVAWGVGLISLGISLALGFGALNAKFGWLIVGYVAMTLSYSVWLKRVAVVELACVAAGFVMRMIAGGFATELVLSNWFLTVASFSSLFVVAGKRYAELTEMGEGNSLSRAVLGDYTVNFLRAAWAMAMTVAVAAYYQWAFERADAVNASHVWYQLSAVPWTIALLRYALLLERGEGGAPEDVLSADRVLQILGVVWVVLFGLGVYDH